MSIVEKLISKVQDHKNSQVSDLKASNEQSFNLKGALCELYNTKSSNLVHLKDQEWQSEDILNLWNALTNLARNFKIFLERSYVKTYPTSRRDS